MAKRMGAASPADLIGKTDADFYPPEQAARFAAADREVLAGRALANFEEDITHLDGTRRIVLSTKVPLKDTQGAVTALVGVGRDITERKRVEEALETSERRFRDIADHAQEWIWEVDAEGKYTYVSQVVEKILGYTAEETLQKHFYDFFHPDDRESLKVAAMAALAAKQPFREFVNRNVHKNGQTVWLATSGIPLLDDKGNLIGYRGVDTDITERKRAEEALATSEKRFRDVADHAQECIWEIDAEGRYTYVSQTIERILGHTPEEVLQKSYHDFFHPDDRDSLKVAAQAFFAQKQPFRGLIDRNVHKNGQTVWFASSGIPLLDEKGNLLGYRGVSMDITERKQAEESLRESRRALFTLMSNLPGMAYRCRNDRDWTMEFVSQGALALTGYTADELMESARISYAQVIHPDDRDAVWNAVQAALQARQPFQIVYRIITATGVENWVWEKGQGVFSEQGELLALEGFIADITERKRAEEALATSEKRFRDIADYAQEWIWEINIEGRYTYASQAVAKVLGYTPEEMLQKNFADFFLPEDREKFQAMAAEAFTHKQPFREFVNRNVHKNGQIVWLLSNGFPLLDEKGNLLGYRGVDMDITERKQAEEALLLKDSALTSSANAVVINGLDGRAFYFNDSFLAMCGYTREEASRLTVFDLYTQEGNQRAFTELNTRGYFIGEGVARRKDGSAFPVAISASTIKDANGRPISTMSSFVDISTRKKAEAELRASEGRFRSLFDNMTEGVALHETVYDEHGAAVNYRLLDVNRQYEILIDLKRDQVVGKLATEVYKSEVAPFLKEFTQVGETGRPCHFETCYAPIKKQLDISVAPLGPGRWATIFSDNTERKRAEQVMRLNAERVQVLLKLNQMTDATLQQITDFALEEAVRITRSQMGYLAFVNDDETVLTMHAWSKQAMKECAVINKPVDYVLSETGLWGEAVRQRRPIITNDYAAPNPAKKGHPAGHVQVRRHMNVPVFAGKHIVLVAGVGNKEDEYDNTDAEQLTLLMEGMWRLIERLRTEEALRESELFLKETQKIGRIGGWKVNPETDYVKGTEGVYNLFEVPLGFKPTMEKVLKFVMPEYIPVIHERLQRSMATGEPFQMEFEVVTATGKHLWVEARGMAQGAVGGVSSVIGTFQDITARKRSEEALRESELFLREAQSIGRIGGWKANPETGYVEWTEGIYHMFEVPLDHKPDFEEGLKFFLPQYIPMIRERLQRTLTTGEPFQMECEVVTATGKRLQGELRGLPHQSTVGKAPCVMGTFQDISKRKRAEEALRESELFLRETQTIGRIGGWKANPETDYLEWTEGIYRLIEAPLDYKPGLSEGLKSYLPQYIPIIREQVQRTLTTGEPFQMECEVVTTTGKHLWAELCGLTQSSAGEAPYVVGTLQDITRRKQAEEALRENELFLRESQIIGRIGGWKTNPETDYLECTEGIYRIIEVPLDYKPGFTEGLKFFMPQYVPVIRERLMRTLTAGEPFQMECEITTAAGKHLWAELRGLAQGVAGKTLCVIGTLQDITERKRAEEVLRQSEESLRQILESVGFGILIVGKDKKVRQANHAALEMIGFGAEAELKGHVCHETICPANCDKCPILDLGQKLDKSERVLVHKNGSRVPILKSVTPITLGGEEVLLESFVDITERKQAEEALSAQQRQLIDIIEFLPDATLAIDKEGRVIIWNKAVEEMTGIPAAEMIGRTGYAHTMAFHEEAKPQLVDLALEDHEEVVSRYSKIIREGDTLAAEVFCRGLHDKKGAWVFAKASPLHDQSGKVVGAIESVRDITRRKQAEEELQFRNVLLLTQQEASIEGSLVVDEESRILTYNRRFVEMWGIAAKLLEGGNDEQVLQFVTTQMADPGAFYQRVQYLYEHRHETSRDELILADGRVFDRYSAPMFGPEERYYGRVWYFRDITDRKRAEQELGRLNADMAHKNRELQNILFAASHDLRSPLLNIHGFGKRLEDACAELRKVVDQPDAGAAELQKIAPLIREGMPKALGFIRSGAARMDTLISGMLRLSRLGRVEMRFELLDIAKLVAEVVNSMASEIQSAGGTVCAVSLPACHGDAVLISQVFANLIENAIKYRDPARPIRVEVSGYIKDADALYCVADNGIGIAAADQERIWNLFCRLNPAATDGEGLGLNLVRRIVERHNGRVWVESVPGTGSKFYVALPTEKTVPS
ncbi:MAG: PAS domain S-box protein [Verrucomicrobiia bacterium]